MAIAKLSPAKLRSLKPGKYGDGGGLWLTVREEGGAFWTFRYRLNGRDREMGLGPLRDVSPARAREEAKRCRNLKREGKDPINERTRRLGVTVPTFRECAEAIIEAKRPEWRNGKHAQQWENTLKTYAYPVLGDLPVDAVATDHVLKVLRPIWTEKTETATRLRQRIESVLDYAKAMKQRAGENPAAWKGHLDKLLAKPAKIRRVSHHAALPYSDLPDFLQALAEQDGIGARALMFTILTAARTGEVIGARKSEIEGDLWTIPAERMKAHRRHRVPLPRQALGVVEALPEIKGEPHLFPGPRRGKPLSNAAMSAVLKRMERSDLTVHGFRSTFRDWCAEQTNFPRELAEAALAHTLRDKTEAAYQRGDLLERRRKMMQAWADHLDSLRKGAEVVPIHRKV